jgi:hypothetical protein
MDRAYEEGKDLEVLRGIRISVGRCYLPDVWDLLQVALPQRTSHPYAEIPHWLSPNPSRNLLSSNE